MIVFFLSSWGMNRSAGQTNRVNREAVLVWFVCSAPRFIPHEPRKKNTSSLYLQCFQQGLFLKFFEKRYHCKYLLMNRGKETVPFAAVCYGVYCFHSKTTLIMRLTLQPQHTKVSHWKAIVPLVLICYWYIAFKVTLLYPLDLHY